MLVTGCAFAGAMALPSMTTENRSECSGELPLYSCKRSDACAILLWLSELSTQATLEFAAGLHMSCGSGAWKTVAAA